MKEYKIPQLAVVRFDTEEAATVSAPTPENVGADIKGASGSFWTQWIDDTESFGWQ